MMEVRRRKVHFQDRTSSKNHLDQWCYQRPCWWYQWSMMLPQTVTKPKIYVGKCSLRCCLILWCCPRDLLPQEAILMRVAYVATWVNAEAHGPCCYWGLWVGQWSWCGQGPCWHLWPGQGCHLKPFSYPWEWESWIYLSCKSFPLKGSQHCNAGGGV